jgi:hypothetical protein
MRVDLAIETERCHNLHGSSARVRMMRDYERQEEDDRFTATLAGLAMAIFLGGLGLYLAEQLAAISVLEDCLLQGRLNCERIQISGAHD